MTELSPVPGPRRADVPAVAELDPARVDVLRNLALRAGADTVVELAALFTSTASDDVTALTEAVERDDRRAADDLAHKLKGAARSLGAVTVADVCCQLERAVRDGAPATALLAELARETDRAGVALTALAGSLAAPAARRTV